MNRPLTGWHVLAIFGGAFAVIIGVNITLAVQAVATFPGVETRNSYLSSQTFDADRAAQESLGWTVTADLTEAELRFAVTDESGGVVNPVIVSAELGRPTEAADDVAPDWLWDGEAYHADLAAAGGRWVLRLELAAADGTRFRRTIPLVVAHGGQS